ncbi:hypothetical protein CI610_00183 [invertebrate metagenome]|uniref:Lipoprotein n=1 Tax=invertebrate metagenome TaxID=1711999 RepID=A0A2H9TC63_9ZZZZ
MNKDITSFHITALFVISLMLVILTGCVTSHTEIADITPATVNTDCPATRQIFTSSLNNFQDIREKPHYYNKATRWRAKQQLIKGQCEIWQWSDHYSYVCSKVLPSEQAAKELYQTAQQGLQQCMPSSAQGWTADSQPLKENNGNKTNYQYNGKTMGSLTVIPDKTLIPRNWSVYFVIDSAINNK